MDCTRWFFSKRANADWRSWRSMVITLPAIVGVLFVAPQAIREKSVASRQGTCQGLVTAYERANHNRCKYVFSVSGKQYTGMASAPTTEVRAGDRVLVYFDSHDPSVNALEDFSSMSDGDAGFVFVLIAIIAIVGGFILFSKLARIAT